MTPLCPECRTSLTEARTSRGIFWHCANCDGRAIGISLLRRLVERPYVASLWGQVAEHGLPGGRPCPFCGNAMTTSPSSDNLKDQIDVCMQCQVAWFDAREFERAPALPEPPPPELSQEALEALGRMQSAAIARSPRFTPETLSAEETLIAASAVFALPVEEEAGWLKHNPWVSWAIAGLVTIAGIVGLLRSDLIREFGLLPAEPFRLGAATFLTSLFLHAGWLQLAASIYFLVLFGDNVEDYLGSGNYLMLLFIAGVVGGILHVLFTTDELTPAVGASPAIAGIVVFYALQFPNTKIRYMHTVRWHAMPASAALALWLGGQIFTTRPEFLRVGTSSVWIYIGGAATGILFWRVFRDSA
ncbi:MAG TPA: rhomboid family intramembrane serine protease [Actinomycetota bacterium]|nr:rhomboid family intramembrane serine protease [Actinomycetota bacterium]